MTAYGAWQYSGGNGMRVGMAVSNTAVNTASATVTFTVDIYTDNQYSWPSDAQTLNYSGDLTGSTGYTNSQGPGSTARDTKVYVYTYSTWGSSPGNRTFTATVGDAVNGVTPTVSMTVAIPARPYGIPAPPSAVTLVRDSDTQGTLTWTRNSTAGGPYDSQTIRARIWYENGSYKNWTLWYNTAVVSGAASSFVKTTEYSANNAYMLSIRANNGYGSSAFTDSNPIFMTPNAPTGVSSALNSAGTSITTTWNDAAYFYPGVGSWKIQRSVSGGAFADVGTVATQATRTFTDASPAGGTNRYRVQLVISGGVISSAYTQGNAVPFTPTSPAAPTLLSPNGVSVDFVNNPVTFTWQHNPGLDSSAQTHFTIETSINSGGSWQPMFGATDVASALSTYTLPAGNLSNGVPYLWRVRTEGIVSAGYGANSASATVLGSTRPVVTLSSPGAVTNSFPITAVWAYAQTELSPQAAFQAQLYDSSGTVLLQQVDGFNANVSAAFTYTTVTGTSYMVKVRAQSAAGVWSNFASTTTSFVLIPPAVAIATGIYQPCTGTVLISLEPGTVVPGTSVNAESVTIERRAEGEDWVILGQGILIPTDFLDGLPMTHGLNEYRITALSSAPSTAVGPILQVYGTDGNAEGDPLWVWVSYGDHFEFDLRVHGDVEISEITGRNKANQHFLGREKPVALVGQNTMRSVNVTGALFYDRRCPPPDNENDACTYDSPPAGWRIAGNESEVVCYRDFTGRRLFGTLSDVTVTDRTWPGKAAVSYSVTQVEYTERYVQLVVV